MIINQKYIYDIFPFREAYIKGKKERPPFVSFGDDYDDEKAEKIVPGELLCLLCKDLLTDAVVISCCGNSYCDECKFNTLNTAYKL